MQSSFRVEKEKIGLFIGNYDIFVPPFQRKLVWNKPKKQALIDSLIKGFPIGALTLYSNKNDGNYYLVDGLQRYNVIKAFLSNPSDIYDFKDFYLFIEDDVSSFCDEFHYRLDKVKSSLKKWFSSLSEAVVKPGKYSFEDFTFFSKALKDGGLEPLSSDFEACSTLRKIIIDKIDFRNDFMALLIYEGDVEDLPELFAKINQKNVSLSSYEILHSMWYEYTMPTIYKGVDYSLIFQKMIDENQSFQTTKVDSFNSFMFLSAIGYEYINSFYSICKKYNFNKSVVSQSFFNEEIIFDAFSTVISLTSNKVHKSMVTAWEHGTDYIFEVGVKILDSFNDLNEFMAKNGINNIPSKYMYLYLFCLFYHFTGSGQFIEPSFVDRIILNEWFRGQNRQISFFKEKIKGVFTFDRDDITSYLLKIEFSDFD